MKTKMTKTSIGAHKKNIERMVYQPMQEKIIAAIKRKRRPLSRAEIAVITGMGINSVCGRVRDLLDGNVLRVTGTKRCPITSHTAQAVFLA